MIISCCILSLLVHLLIIFCHCVLEHQILDLNEHSQPQVLQRD